MLSTTHYLAVAEQALCVSIVERRVLNRDLHFLGGTAFHQAREKLAADLGQEGLGENRIHHAAAALKFGAATGDQVDDCVIIAESNLLILADSLLDATELEPDNRP